MSSKIKAPVQIAESVYWLGASDSSDFLQFNSFLVYREGMGIIIDPGPRRHFREIFEAAIQIVPIEEITAMVLSTQDPEVCSSLTSWEEMGFSGTYVCHWRAGMFIESYGLLSPFFNIREEQTGPQESYLSLEFISYPYLHSQAVILTYDRKTDSLFSADLFGVMGFSSKLYADEKYYQKVRYYHKKFIPDREGRSAALKGLGALGLERVCPHHGCIIDKDLDRYFIDPVDESPETPSYAGETPLQDSLNFQHVESLILSRGEVLLDPQTGLYNSLFVENMIPEFLASHDSGAVIRLRLDGMGKFNLEYGREERDRALVTFSSILQENMPAGALLFREQSIYFCLMLPDLSEGEYLNVIEDLQNAVRESEAFIREMTFSAAVLGLHELRGDSRDKNDMLTGILRERQYKLQSMDYNSVCSSSEEKKGESHGNSIVLIEPDLLYAKLLEEYFDSIGFAVYACNRGGEAIQQIKQIRPGIIISEIHVPQLDGFRIREQQRQISAVRDIPFLFISHHKTENIIHRANQLGVPWILRKPIILEELAGLVQSLVHEERSDE